MTCWRRVPDWQVAEVWHNLHVALLRELRSVDKLDLSRVCKAAASVPSPGGASAATPRAAAGLDSSAAPSRTVKVSG